MWAKLTISSAHSRADVDERRLLVPTWSTVSSGFFRKIGLMWSLMSCVEHYLTFSSIVSSLGWNHQPRTPLFSCVEYYGQHLSSLLFALYLIGMMTTSWIANVSRLGLSLSKAGFVGHRTSSFFPPKQNLEHPGTTCQRGSCQAAWQMNCDTNLWRLFEAPVSINLFLLE